MRENGLKLKYNVTKVDTGEPVGDCFVLRPTKDPAAIEALRTYASRTQNDDLRQDILEWIKEIVGKEGEENFVPFDTFYGAAYIVGEENFVPFDRFYGPAYVDELRRVRALQPADKERPADVRHADGPDKEGMG